MKFRPVDAGVADRPALLYAFAGGMEYGALVKCYVIVTENLKSDEVNFEGGAEVELLAVPRLGEWIDGFGVVTAVVHYPKDHLPDTPMIQLYVRRGQTDATRS